jgi:hypothetical protein
MNRPETDRNPIPRIDRGDAQRQVDQFVFRKLLGAMPPLSPPRSVFQSRSRFAPFERELARAPDDHSAQ